MRLAKWGNSLAVRLPSRMVEEMNLREGDEIELVKGERETFIVYRYESPVELLQRIRHFRGRLPKGFRFDRDDAHAR
ncbi:MAG: AbrB/MazE/SpoVT family DNA-binding domain-containing protein [Candidatus Kapabacteria bacterium]|nr:AbrB/MazE/SpoVT family DNA-binding domain-containing protein [Candidatus Kapabacteria bacterium]